MKFTVDEAFLKAPKVALVFHGLDTFSNITVNDNIIGISENMFVKYAFDVKPYLKVDYLFKIYIIRSLFCHILDLEFGREWFKSEWRNKNMRIHVYILRIKNYLTYCITFFHIFLMF